MQVLRVSHAEQSRSIDSIVELCCRAVEDYLWELIYIAIWLAQLFGGVASQCFSDFE